MNSPMRICITRLLSLMVLIGIRPYPAPEHAVIGCRVEQHQREHEEAGAPEHERQARMRRGRFLDRDREGNHVGPEGESERAESGEEEDGDEAVGRSIASPLNAFGQKNRRHDADCWEDQEIWPLDPTVHDSKIFNKGKPEYDEQEQEQRERQNRNESERGSADGAVAFADEPGGAE